MPRIPNTGIAQPNLVSMDVERIPTQSIEQAGLVHKAQAGLADKVTGIASEFGQKLAHAEARAKSLDIRNRYAIESENISAELKADDKYTKDVAGFASEYERRVSTMKGVLMRDLSSSLEHETANNALVDLEFNSIRGAYGWERNQRIERAYNTFTNTVTSYGQSQVLKFDPSRALSEGAKLKNSFTESTELFTPEQIDKAHADIDNTRFDSMIGYYYNNPSMATQGLDILEDRHTQSQNLKYGIDPNKIAGAIHKLKSISNVNTEVSKASVNSRLQDIQTSIKKFSEVTPEAFEEIKQDIYAGDFSDKEEMLDTVVVAQHTNEVVQKYLDMPGAEKDMFSSGVFKFPEAPPEFNATQRAQWERVGQQAIKDARIMMETKGADFAKTRRADINNLEAMALDIESDTFVSDAKNYAMVTKATQKEYGIKNVIIPTEQMMDHYAKTITNPEGNYGASAIDKIVEAYGEDTGSLIQTMIERKKIDASYATAFYTDSLEAKEAIINNLKRRKEIVSEYKLKGNSIAPDEADLFNDESITSFERSVNIANPEGANSQIVLGFKNAIALEYKRGMAIEGLDHDDAKENAINKMLKNNFSFTNNSVPLTIPKKISVEPDTVEDFVSDFRSNFPRSAEKLRIVPPKTYAGSKENYINHIRRTAQWVWDGNDGAQLYEMTDNNRPVLVLDETGLPIKMKYMDMNESFFTEKDKPSNVITAGIKAKF